MPKFWAITDTEIDGKFLKFWRDVLLYVYSTEKEGKGKKIYKNAPMLYLASQSKRERAQRLQVWRACYTL